MSKTAQKEKKKITSFFKRSKPTKGLPRKKSQAKKTSVKPAKVFVYALALAAIGGGGYLVYDRMRRKKQIDSGDTSSANNADTIIINNSLPDRQTGLPVSYSSGISKLFSSASDSFPLKRGSKGSRVMMLQKALSKTSPSIVIDGVFGSQTAGALKSAGYPEVVNEALFSQITAMTSNAVQVIFNPASLASALYKAAQSKNLNEVLNLLRQIKSVAEYSSVNDYYKKQGFISKTIVTDLLEYAFKGNTTAKEKIRNEFLRIGLKVNSAGTWSLQGIRLYKDIITLRETIVTDSRNNKIPVRKNTILGDGLETANGMTSFRSVDNSILKVPTQDIKYT